MGHPPGLVSREKVSEDAHTVTFVEVWDLTAPGCPMVAIDLWQMTRATDVVSVRRRATCPKAVFLELEKAA